MNIVEPHSGAEYRSDIDLKGWVTGYFAGKSYGNKSSNIVQSINRNPCRDCKSSILQVWEGYDT